MHQPTSTATYFAPHTRYRRRDGPARTPLRSEQILLVYNVVEQLTQGHDYELASENEGIHIAQAIESAIGERFVVLHVPIYGTEVEQALRPYDPSRALIFNLCESLNGLSHLEAAAAARMRALGFRLSGNPPGALALCQNKVATKQLLAARGLPTPNYQVMDDAHTRLQLPYPLIVKPMAEDASLGIERNAVCTDELTLRQRVRDVLTYYKQPALIEEFIIGREFNISVWGNQAAQQQPKALPVAELEFFRQPDPLKQVVSYASKWLETDPGQWMDRVVVPAPIEPALAAKLSHLAERAFQFTGCQGYARVDMRLRDRQAYILEVNPNPGIAPDAGFAKAAAAAGFTYAQTIERIIQYALESPL